jgi:cell division inhibitor SepF
MGVYLGLVEDDDYADVEYDGNAERVPVRRSAYNEPAVRDEPPREPRYSRQPEAHVETYDSSAINYTDDFAPSMYQITSVHPRTYNEARTIGEAFRKGTPVIMNLTEMEDADAKRLVDFAAGLTFGLHGRIERVTAKVFLLSPHNVTVTAQDRAKIVESGFYNQA